MSVAESIRNKLTTNLKTKHLDVINESHMHNVPKNAETHFKVVVVSELFSNVPLITVRKYGRNFFIILDHLTTLSTLQRHRMVNNLLKDELTGGVHALSIEAYTTEQWQQKDKHIDPSPNCRGGFGK